jgi:hypothetical protein
MVLGAPFMRVSFAHEWGRDRFRSNTRNILVNPHYPANSPQSKHLPHAGNFSEIGKIEIERLLEGPAIRLGFSIGADAMLSLPLSIKIKRIACKLLT